jgi:lipoprotein-releasing system permease protein
VETAMLELRIARRFLWRSKGQSLLIVLGIAVGIAVQVFVGSLITSLQDSLVETTVGSSSQVTMQPAEGDDSLSFSPEMRSQVEADSRITAVAPVQVVSALIPVGDGGSPVVAKGGAFADLDSIYKLSDSLIAGQATLAGDKILLGKEFVEDNALTPGDAVELVLADGSRVTATLEGAFDLGTRAVNQQSVFMGLEQASAALGRSQEQVSAVEMQIDDVFASQEVAADLSAQFPEVQVVEWQETNADLLSALQSQSTSSIMIQVFVIVAVMLGIASTLALSAVQKTRQIGILKALGMKDARTGLVFLYQAGILGVVGTVLGLIISLALIEVFSAIARQGDSGLFPIEPRPSFILISAAIGIGVALVSAIIPYRKTSRLDPIEVIQGA